MASDDITIVLGLARQGAEGEAWLGRSPMNAPQHDLKTRNAHFDLGAGIGEPPTHALANNATQEHAQRQSLERVWWRLASSVTQWEAGK